MQDIGKDRFKLRGKVVNMLVADCQIRRREVNPCRIVPPSPTEALPVVVPPNSAYTVRNEYGLPDTSLQTVNQFLHGYFFSPGRWRMSVIHRPDSKLRRRHALQAEIYLHRPFPDGNSPSLLLAPAVVIGLRCFCFLFSGRF